MAGFAQLAAGSAPIAVIATMVIVNARLMLYGAAIADRFRGQPRWFRIVGPMLLIDQTFAAATDAGPGERPGVPPVLALPRADGAARLDQLHRRWHDLRARDCPPICHSMLPESPA